MKMMSIPSDLGDVRAVIVAGYDSYQGAETQKKKKFIYSLKLFKIKQIKEFVYLFPFSFFPSAHSHMRLEIYL